MSYYRLHKTKIIMITRLSKMFLTKYGTRTDTHSSLRNFSIYAPLIIDFNKKKIQWSRARNKCCIDQEPLGIQDCIICCKRCNLTQICCLNS